MNSHYFVCTEFGHNYVPAPMHWPCTQQAIERDGIDNLSTGAMFLSVQRDSTVYVGYMDYDQLDEFTVDYALVKQTFDFDPRSEQYAHLEDHERKGVIVDKLCQQVFRDGVYSVRPDPRGHGYLLHTMTLSVTDNGEKRPAITDTIRLGTVPLVANRQGGNDHAKELLAYAIAGEIYELITGENR